jgi:hypothetical protein
VTRHCIRVNITQHIDLHNENIMDMLYIQFLQPRPIMAELKLQIIK